MNLRELGSGLTPRAAFHALCPRPYAFFLDSGLVSERMGRYSYLGAEPFLVIQSKRRRIRLLRRGQPAEEFEGNPFQQLRTLLRRYSIRPEKSCVPFLGGAVGYFGYDLCHFVERLPETTLDDIGLPDMHFAFHDIVVAFDHLEGRAYAVAVDVDETEGEAVEQRLEQTVEMLSRSGGTPAPTAVTRSGSEPVANFTKDEYLAAVQRAKDYIAAGDIFQVNLSQRFQATTSLKPHELYTRLRTVNPAPFACYQDLGHGMAVVSASPELFLRVRGRHVVTRPIKGTRRRGPTEAEDAQLREELLRSPKDDAELTMIIDLERNDLGRVCGYGTVRVTERKALETFPTVHHLVGTVEGTLHDRYDLIDLIKATFPGGSITGAPKIRAMEIIDELEPTKRSVYTGAIACLGFNGNADLNIAIRTFLVNGQNLYFQVGGGIVADSELEAEYDETIHKARGLFASLGIQR